MLSLRSEDEDWSLHSEALTDFAMLVDLWKDRPDERNSLERDMWDAFKVHEPPTVTDVRGIGRRPLLQLAVEESSRPLRPSDASGSLRRRRVQCGRG